MDHAGLFERTLPNLPKPSTTLRVLYPLAAEFFKDAYSLELPGLADTHSEADLHRALPRNLCRPPALGRAFRFIGSEYPIQVDRHAEAHDRLVEIGMKGSFAIPNREAINFAKQGFPSGAGAVQIPARSVVRRLARFVRFLPLVPIFPVTFHPPVQPSPIV